MSKITHRIFIFILAIIVILITIYVAYYGLGFYKTSIEERFFHPQYYNLKPSGLYGHGYGIIGSGFMIIGVLIYMLRKRFRPLFRLGFLKHWLEFHIFLCTLGPMLVLFHTSFKFGGIVAISFWSMVAVFLSGIIGRFIYIQIPRNIEGRELTQVEVDDLRRGIDREEDLLKNLDDKSQNEILKILKLKSEGHNNFLRSYFRNMVGDRKSLQQIKSIIKRNNLSSSENRAIAGKLKSEISLMRKIGRIKSMQNLLKYWHVIHMPFALIMIVVMLIHVAVTIAFGSRWIF